MERLRRVGLIALSTTVCLVYANAQNSEVAKDGEGGLGVSIYAVETVPNPVRVGSPVEIRIDVLNNTDKVLSLTSEPEAWFIHELIDGEGNPVRETEKGCPPRNPTECGPGVAHGGTVRILPHDHFIFGLRLTDVYQLDKPGIYSMLLKQNRIRLYEVPPDGDLSRLDKHPFTKIGLVTSNAVKIEILP
ncbi:MAG: hypothetical protein WBQ94_16960 [Terracidiphilus sp.]